MGYVGAIKCLYQLPDSEGQIIPSLLRAVISPVINQMLTVKMSQNITNIGGSVR